MKRDLEKDIENQKELLRKFQELAKAYNFDKRQYEEIIDRILDNLAWLMKQRNKD